jgi:transcriptional regulator with XRE-family HTH domain
MTKDTFVPENERAIGAAAQRIRKRRGLSLDVVGDLTGVGKGNLSKIERGKRRITQWKVLEDLADALSCSVTDLTGEPYQAPDRHTAEALAVIPHLTIALYETPGAHDDGSARPLGELLGAVTRANALCEDSQYARACRDLPDLLPALHLRELTGSSDDQREALAGLVEGYVVAFGVTRHLGRPELAMQAAQRARDAAEKLADPAFLGFARLMNASVFSRIGARQAAQDVLAAASSEIEPYANPDAPEPRAAEAMGVMHLVSAQLAARGGQVADAHAHLDEAESIARHTGERNTLHWRFGKGNVTNWRLAIGVELARGPETAERIEADPPRLVTAGRRSRYHFDLARGYAQAGGSRDQIAYRHLDTADRIAPGRTRMDPLAKELVRAMRRRAKRSVWELDSLCRRFGVD